MKEISQQELKFIELELLQKIHDFCCENHIVYYLCGGTLLGAVRHRGFIPWDDDVDIYMPRPDYEKFIACFDGKDCKVMTHLSSEEYYLPYAKVCDNRTEIQETVVKTIPNCGVYVDVFPLDGLSDDRQVAKRIHDKNSWYMRINSVLALIPPKNRTLKNVIIKAMQKTIPQKVILRRINKISKKYSYNDSALVGVAFGYYGERETLDKKFFEQTIELEFEGRKFNAPGKPHEYLEALYGNYMELPAKEKRVSHHSFRAFWKERY